VNRTEHPPRIRSTGTVVAGVAATGLLTLVLSACSSGAGKSGGPSGIGLSDVGTRSSSGHSTSSTRSTAPSTTALPAPVASVSQIPTSSGEGSSQTLVLHTGFPSSTHAAAPPPVQSQSLPTPTGPVTFVSWALQRPYNCREHADLVDTAPDVSAAIDVTVLLQGVSAGSLSIVAPNPAVRTLPNASSLLSSSSLGHGLYKATYRSYVSLFAPNFTPVTFSSLTAVSAGSQYSIVFASSVTITLDDCHS
jgi:hypothetical protein